MATKRKPTSALEADKGKKKHKKTRTRPITMKELYSGRDSLGNYIHAPENYDSTRVIAYDDEFVVIRDMYPKSQIHYLVLARERWDAWRQQQQHPIETLGEEKFLARMRWKVKQVKEMVVQELQNGIKSDVGGGKRDDEEKMCANDTRLEVEVVSKQGFVESRSSDSAVGVATAASADDKQQERDWDREVMAGIHARPSMNHLHVHVMSIDRHSTWMKHRNHYNSFTTQFFIPLEEFPLAKDDMRRFPEQAEAYLRSDLKCWRCGLNFGNRFASLKKHLAREFEEWRKE